MLAGFGIEISLGKPKVNDIHDFALFSPSNHEIIGFDVSMKEALSVNLLQPRNNLYPNIVSCGNREFLITQ